MENEENKENEELKKEEVVEETTQVTEEVKDNSAVSYTHLTLPTKA